MAYLTQEDIEALRGEPIVTQILMDSTGSPSPDRLQSAIDEASSTIDRNLRGRYTVPFTSLPGELLGIAHDLTWYALRRFSGNTPEDDEKRYQNALKSLRDISSGAVQLSSDVERVQTPNGGGRIAVGTRNLTYDDACWKQYA